MTAPAVDAAPMSEMPSQRACRCCRVRHALTGRRPGRRAPWGQSAATAIALPLIAFAWFHHGDASAVAAMLILSVAVVWLWARWVRGCRDCAELRRGPRSGAG